MTATVIFVMIVAFVVLFPFAFAWFIFRRVKAATLHSCAPQAVPPTFGAGVADFVHEGFVVAGAILITNPGLPDAYVVLFFSQQLNAYGRLWVTERDTTTYSLTTPLRLGKLATSLTAPTGTDATELQQVFPGASLAELCRRHAEAQQLLVERGVDARTATAEGAEAYFREEWTRDLQAMRHAGPKLVLDFVWRSVLRRPRFIGPLADQRDIDERIGRLSTH